MLDTYDWTHPHEGRHVPAGIEFPHPVMPDNGCNYKRHKMREDGYELFQDFQHPDRDYVTRWWFRNLKVWHKYVPGIEEQGFTAIHHLKIT